MKAAFYTLGCKVNQYETQILQQQFAADGFEIVDCDEYSDVYIINSCTVTAAGDKKTRQMMRRLKKQNPAAVVAVTGCFPQAFPDAAAKQLPEADIITGSYERSALLGHVHNFLASREKIVAITPHRPREAFEPMRAKQFSEHTRAFVKIEDGCDRYCSYCIIPTARGPVRSKPLDEIRAELEGLAQQGYFEVVLVGINLPSYGKEIGLRLIDAVETACSVPGIQRIRLGSLEPELLTDDDLARLAKLPKFCPQFHLALQSGCSDTLRRMRRRYDAPEYRRIVDSIRNIFDNPSITTDIMVGFPGETEREFEESLQFAVEIGLAKAHVFAYSKRPGTRAAEMPDQLPRAVKEERSARLIAATDQTRIAFMATQIGRSVSVLFETRDEAADSSGCHAYHGFSENYTPVTVFSNEDLCGVIRRVKITALGKDTCIGEVEN